MEFGRLLGWLLLNVAVPLLAPVALLPLLGARKGYAGKVKTLIRASLGDGQLFWTVIAMCAAAWYEAAVRLGELQGTAEQIASGRLFGWAMIGWHTGIIVVSSVLVLLGAMESAESPDAKTSETMRQPGKIMIISIYMSILTAASVISTHVWAS